MVSIMVNHSQKVINLLCSGPSEESLHVVPGVLGDVFLKY